MWKIQFNLSWNKQHKTTKDYFFVPNVVVSTASNCRKLNQKNMFECMYKTLCFLPKFINKVEKEWNFA